MIKKIKTWLKNNKKITAIFLIAFIPRVIFMLVSFFILGDYNFREGQDIYLEAGLNLFKHGVFTTQIDTPFIPRSFPAPGYPILLAVSWLIVPKNLFIVFWQNIMFSVFIVLVYKFSRLFFNNFISLAAAMFMAFEPLAFVWSNVVMSETPFLLFFMLSVYLLFLFFKEQKWKFLIWSAVFLALAALIRPIVTFFYPVIFISAVAILWDKVVWQKIAKFLIIYLIIFLAVISPWVIRNKIQFDDYTISTLPNFLYFLGASRDFLILSQGMSQTEADNYLQSLAVKKAGVDNFNQIMFADKYIPILKEITRSLIREHPFVYLKWHLIRSIPVLTDSGWMNILNFLRIKTTGDQSINISLLMIERDFQAFFSSIKNNNIFLIRILGISFWAFIDLIAFLGVIFMLLRRDLPGAFPGWILSERQKNQEKARGEFKIALAMLMIISYFVFFSSWAAMARLRLPFQPFLFIFFFYACYRFYHKFSYIKKSRN